MKEKIMDYLTLKYLMDRDFQADPNQRIRTAFILAKKDYKRLTIQDKEKIMKKLGDYKKYKGE